MRKTARYPVMATRLAMMEKREAVPGQRSPVVALEVGAKKQQTAMDRRRPPAIVTVVVTRRRRTTAMVAVLVGKRMG